MPPHTHTHELHPPRLQPGVLPYNPTTDVMDALHFALFQTCDKSGRGYAHDPNQRYVP